MSIQLLCNKCKRPIDPQADNYFDMPRLEIQFGQKRAMIGNIHFCSKAHFISWLHKNSDPSSIISISDDRGPAA